MVLTSQFIGRSEKPSGSSDLLGASLDFMVAPTSGNRERLEDAYRTEKPGEMQALDAYFTRHARRDEQPQAAAPVVSAAKKPTTGNGSGF